MNSPLLDKPPKISAYDLEIHLKRISDVFDRGDREEAVVRLRELGIETTVAQFEASLNEQLRLLVSPPVPEPRGEAPSVRELTPAPLSRTESPPETSNDSRNQYVNSAHFLRFLGDISNPLAELYSANQDTASARSKPEVSAIVVDRASVNERSLINSAGNSLLGVITTEHQGKDLAILTTLHKADSRLRSLESPLDKCFFRISLVDIEQGRALAHFVQTPMITAPCYQTMRGESAILPASPLNLAAPKLILTIERELSDLHNRKEGGQLPLPSQIFRERELAGPAERAEAHSGGVALAHLPGGQAWIKLFTIMQADLKEDLRHLATAPMVELLLLGAARRGAVYDFSYLNP